MIWFYGAAAGGALLLCMVLYTYERPYLKENFGMKGIYCLLYPGALWLCRHLPGKRMDKKLDTMRKLYPSKDARRLCQEQYLKNISHVLLIFFVTNAAALALCMAKDGGGMLQNKYQIARKEPGGGSFNVALEAEVAGQSQEVVVTVGERRLEDAQMEQLQETCRAYIDTYMLGENTDEGHILYDLDFFSQIPGCSVSVAWETSNYLIVGMDGTVKNQDLSQETAVTVTALCTYFDQSWMYEKELVIAPAVKSQMQQAQDELYDALAVQESATAGEDYLILPQFVGEEPVTWSEKSSVGPEIIVVMGCMVIVLIFAREGEALLKAQQKRSAELILDYPVFVHKVVLLLGSGMTCKSAWLRIISDYNKMLEKGGKRQYLYEEMIVAANEMRQGTTEIDAYENFGRRCGLGPYLKFSSILIQSVKTGAKGMGRMLADAGDEAVLLRRETAKRMGEEVGTKLLFPMIVLLAVVMAVVMVPAFMSMNI